MCAARQTANRMSQNRRAVWRSAPPRLARWRYRPKRLRIGGSRTSIRPPFQAFYEAADERFLRLRIELLGKQRLRAIHGQVRGERAEFRHFFLKIRELRFRFTELRVSRGLRSGRARDRRTDGGRTPAKKSG